MLDGDKEALVRLTAINDQRWKAIRDYVKQFSRDELADIHEMLAAREEEYDEDGITPDDEELVVALCAMIGMCKMVEEIWRDELT